MSKSLVFLWKPFEDTDITPSIIAELSEIERVYSEDESEPYESFSWDNEDNEGSPKIAEYVAGKYNEYFFFIDMHSGRNKFE